jgi:hypothetical protein
MHKLYSDARDTPSEVLNLEARIIELQKQLETLYTQKESLVAQHALITRLPNEVLSRIFELGIHDNLRLLPRVHLVSRLWREVALATPTLSSYLRLDGGWGYGGSRPFLEHVKTLLERAGNAALSVDLDCRYVDDTVALEELASGIGPHLGQAYSFSLSAPDWEWFDVVQKHVTLKLDAKLQELTLRVDPSDDETAIPVPFLRDNRTYVRLHTLVIEQVPLVSVRGAFLPALRSFRLSRDTRFHSMNRMAVPLSELLDFVGAHPQLEELHIHGIRFTLDALCSALLDEPQRVHAPAMKKMSFTHVDGAGIGACLTSLDLPLLNSLILSMDACDNADLGFLASLLVESPLPNLQFLDVRNANTDGTALHSFIRVLRKLPKLIALGICSPPTGTIGGRIFEILSTPTSATGKEAWLVPQLKALAITNCRDISGHEVLRVVSARKGAWNSGGGDILKASVVQKLDFVRIAQCYGLEDDIADALQDAVTTFRHSL